MDLTSITAALSGIKSATDIARLIKNSGASLEAAEIKFKLAELLDSLSDSKIEIANIKEMVLEKELKIQELTAQIDLRANVIWENPYYFKLSETGEKDGPFCQKCYDSDKELIRLQSPNNNGYWQCKACKSDFKDSSAQSSVGYRPPVKNGRDWSSF
jgi:ribosomal protein L37AE/L43A